MKKNILNLIGNTPLLRLYGIEKKYKLKSRLYAKLEYLNPFGSIKDRPALKILENALSKDLLRNKTTIIDATSGNMGVSLAAISKILNYKCTIIMPEDASQKRKDLLKLFGAELILTSSKFGISESITLAKSIASADKNYYYTNQFENTSSIDAHLTTTAPEIKKQLGKNPDIIVCGMGTGGTIMGIAKYFSGFQTQIYGVTPDNNSKIPGLRPGTNSSLINIDLITKILEISDTNLLDIQSNLINCDGIFAGFSSCANLSACLNILNEKDTFDQTVVMIFADSGERYI